MADRQRRGRGPTTRAGDAAGGVDRRLGELRARAAPAARSRPRRRLRGGQPDAAGPLRGGGAARGAADRRRGVSRRSCWRARSRSTRRWPMTRPPCSASCARRFRPRSSTPSAAGRHVHRRHAGAARPPRGSAREHRRAGRLDPAQRRPGGRRPPRRAAAAQRQGPRGERDRRPADRPHAAPGLGVGDGRARAGRGPRRQHPAPGRADPGPARLADRSAVELAGRLHPTPAVGAEPAGGAERDPGTGGL